MDTINRILAISRISEDCRDVVNNGISLAKKLGAELEVLHLISNPVDQEALNAPLPYPDAAHKTYASIREEAKEELEKILRRELNSGFPIKLIVRDGSPIDEVTSVVKEENIDLIVMLAHQETRLEHALFGSESEAILRSMPCNILLVKKEPHPIKW
ncbi:universal stress protein [Geomonas sp. Red32]|uniref:universal stress protein n=1 Tax=Geomonas sp. Red32 TaxID=2912856 RepID=UPI00202D0468|nr:universal stress protein [Geomonas sp. Red32]MCM0081518.1 universal stress protein [Geomonas sp. Red32]